VVEAGGIPVIVDPVASGSVISRRSFETFVLPGMKRLMGHIKSLGMPAVLHICGRCETIIDLMADSGAQVLSVDVIDLSTARRLVGERVCLMGNVPPAEVLLGGTAESVDASAKACITACGDSAGGFILASGCEVPIEAPPENVLALMESARKYGGKG
jgi:uroporphyrinogen decarboxylase